MNVRQSSWCQRVSARYRATTRTSRMRARWSARHHRDRPIWAARRDPPSHRDATLSQIARVWFESLPVPLRPEHLCVRYPRIANRLALCWPDSTLTQRLFENLVVDKRGGRQGFPTEVAAELAQLQRFAAHLERRR
jgi:hypothetical protein